MKNDSTKPAEAAGISKVKLALGAASLFLFIVGVKRTFRTEDGQQVDQEGQARPQREPLPRAR